MEYILEIQNVRKTYSKKIINLLGKTDNEYFYVLNDVNIKIQKGKVTALLGGNGSGKSTLFNIICGYLPTNEGKILFNSSKGYLDLTKIPAYKTAKAGVGRMFQGTHIFKNMTVLENMLLADENTFGEFPFVSMFSSKKNAQIEGNRVLEAEKIFNSLLGQANPLWEKREHLAGSLSYGQQRLLALARLFMNNHLELILLDEPCAGVNPDIAELLKKIIHYLRETGKTVLLIEHNLDFVKDISDYCYYLENGEISLQGTYAEVITNSMTK
ncbi:ATP-binding cassette domain-containing protein [Arcicella sp. LKC2W]|uniref:ABC transporter ATP-binding protein n=1 Tax=Arcicella sp. LKC2W TaxID=2984198 RepID=UPI002B20B4A6|nr:ATP-binding cassette domain-containing protein [Arcicella sp. LKC2W]MEA5461665.1 ATP-binding cassette domain-containing protein [Arcicella sp. LKC2W]